MPEAGGMNVGMKLQSFSGRNCARWVNQSNRCHNSKIHRGKRRKDSQKKEMRFHRGVIKIMVFMYPCILRELLFYDAQPVTVQYHNIADGIFK